MIINKCKNLLGERCKLNGEICNHLVYDGNCDLANVESIGKPTFKDCLEMFSAELQTQARKQELKHDLETVIKNTDLSWESPVEDFSYCVAEQFARKLSSVYMSSTIASFIQTVYSMGNPTRRSAYKAKNLKIPVFDKYYLKVTHGKKVPMTWEMKNDIMFKMETYRRAAMNQAFSRGKRIINRNYFVALWFGFWFGTRPGDVNRMKWENITYLNNIPHLKWVPNKTKHSTGQEICWPIPDAAFNQIKTFVGVADEFCLVTDEKYVPLHAVKKRCNTGLHTAMWRNLNRYFRSIGLTGWGGYYSLRYMNSQDAYNQFGAMGERAKMGHSIAVGQKSYYNKNNHEMRIL